MHELPGPLCLTSTFPFVGRSAELETLRALMPMAEGEGRRVVLLGGEPGSGKSRLVREFAARGGRRRRARPLRRLRRGRAHALRAVRRGARPPRRAMIDPAELRAALGTAGGELTRLLPDLAAAGGRAAAAGQGRSRHRAPPAAHGGHRPARRASAGRPVLLVLEDGHWADAPTLLLLRHLARAAGRARVLVLATFRDTEADLPGDALGDARRPAPLRRRRAAAAGRPLGRRGRRVRPPRRRRPTPTPARPSSPTRSQSSPAATRSSSASCGAAWSRPQIVEVVDGAIRLTAAADRARHPRERARGRQPAALAPGAAEPPTSSSSRPRPEPSSSFDIVRGAAGPRRARAARRARRGRRAAG